MTRIFSGAATVTNGDATVVITSGVLTAANCPDDAPIALNGVAYHVLSRTDSTHLELTRNFAGTTGSVAVEIDPLTPAALSVVNVAVLAANVQAQLNVLDKNSQGLFYNRIGVTGDTDPAPGNLAFDNGDPTAVTEFYVDNLDANQRSVTGLIDLWTSGTIVLIRSLATTAYAAYRLPTGASAQSGYYKASAQYVDHDGVLADGEPVSIGWFRVGEGLEIDAVGDYAGRAAYNTQPAGFVYLSSNGNTTTVTVAALFRKNSATSGDWSAAVPFQGIAGDKGWAPRFAVVADGERRVMQLAGYVGGTGDAPTANIGQYVATGGYTATIGSATDIRGAVGATGAAGTDGTNGTDGADGLDGTDPGVLLIWDDGTTDANPGSGVLRANNALATSATFLYVSKANRVGTDISVFLATLDDSSSTRKGIVTLTRPTDKAQATFDVVTLTDATGYVKVGVINGGGATFIDNDLISFQFSASGDKGLDGIGAGNFVTELEPAIDPTGYLVKFSDASGVAGESSGILATDVPSKAANGSDFGNKRATFDNLHQTGADIASAATVNLETATGIFVEVTGTVATTVITLSDGHQRLVRAAAAWPLTHGTNLQIQGGASYTCAAGDLLLVQADGAVIRVTIFPVDALPVVRVTNAKLAQIATARFKGRTTASTGDVEDLTATQATAMLNVVVGDTGSGGTKGLVPAPASGDASKFLKGDGTWGAVAVGANWGLAASVASSALTVTLVDAAGAAVSSGNPLVFSFRNATAGTGTLTNLSVTTALTQVLSSGSTLGATSGVAFRLWAVLFNDGGTARLGLIKCWDGSSIARLRENGVMSATSEGGAGAADSAGLVYSSAAVSSKAIRVLGYLEWTSGLATAGTWSVAPDVIQIFGPGVPLPGDMIQMKSMSTSTATGVTSSTYTDTLLTSSIVLSSPANPVAISWGAGVGVDASNVQAFFGLHRGGSLIQQRRLYGQTAGVLMQCLQAQAIDYPGVAGSQTYMVKIRNNNNTTNVSLPYTTTTDSGQMQLAELVG